jgi:methionyl-tRNA synthetase
LRAWLADKPDWKANVMATSVRKWLTEGLEDRSVSRDIRWGIPVPGDESKKLYVWFEAPMGYISFLMEYAKAIGREDMWKEFWDRNSDAEIIHFIGKDNVVFHTIIWPAILMADGRFKLPTNVPGNEFVNLE